MGLYRLYPTKDTFVANFQNGLSVSQSNMGASEILQLYKQEEGPGIAHVLIQFNTNSLPPPVIASGTDFFLALFDAQHSSTLPFGYNAFIYANDYNDWNEGPGQDLDAFTDVGTANWISASALSPWNVPGAYPNGGTPLEFHFDTGHEDMFVDVTTLMPSALFGFMVQVDPVLELSGAGDFYIKEFHSRQTHFPAKRPYLEIRWNDWTGSLTTDPMLLVSSGAWSGSYIDPIFRNVTGTIVDVTRSIVDPTGSLAFSIPMRSLYDESELIRFRVFARDDDVINSAVRATASSDAPGVVLTDAYYRVVDDVTGVELVPFSVSTGDTYTKLSWDDLGNYFDFYMECVPTGSLCRFDLCYVIGGRQTVYRGDAFKFVTESPLSGRIDPAPQPPGPPLG